MAYKTQLDCHTSLFLRECRNVLPTNFFTPSQIQPYFTQKQVDRRGGMKVGDDAHSKGDGNDGTL